MSTILKALRRLEEDSPTNTEDPSGGLRGADPIESAELRDRILAEESAVQAARAADQESNRTKRFAIAGAVALLTVGLAVGAYTLSTRDDSEKKENLVAATLPSASPSSAEAAPPVENPRPARTLPAVAVIAPANDQVVASPAPVRAPVPKPKSTSARASVHASAPVLASPTSPGSADANLAASPGTKSVAPPAPTPPEAKDEMALAAVSPTPATLAASSGRTVASSEKALVEPPPKRPSQERRTRPKAPAKASVPVPPSVSAPKPPAARPSPAPPISTASSPPIQKAKPAQSQPSPRAQQVDRLDSPVFTPDLTIVRTSWHPRPARRSAKIRLEETDEVLNLREGDAVGGLVIQEISPSAVVFKAGDVEIHRRVGQPGSGG